MKLQHHFTTDNLGRHIASSQRYTFCSRQPTGLAIVPLPPSIY